MFKNLRIGAKIIVGFGVSIVLLLVISGFGLLQVDTLEEKVVDINSDKFPKTVSANHIIDYVHSGNEAVLKSMIVKDITERQKYFDEMKSYVGKINKELEYLEKAIKTENGKRLLADMAEKRDIFVASRAKAVDEIKKENIEMAQVIFFGEMEQKRLSYMKAVENLIQYQVELMNEAGTNAQNVAKDTLTYVSILSLIALIVSLVLAILIKNGITRPVNLVVESAKNIAKGDFSTKLAKESNDEIGELVDAMNAMSNTIVQISDDTKKLIEAGQKGKLDQRGEASKYQGGWSDLIRNLNGLIDSFVAPINVTAEYIDRISKGNMPPRITDTYYGDFNEIKNNMNQLIDTLESFTSDMENMAKQHELGDIDVVMNYARFTGTYSDMAKGVNELVNAHIDVKKMAMKVVSEYGNGNFNEIMPQLPGKKAFINATLNQLRANLITVNNQISTLTEATIQGKLDARAETNGLQGDWAKLINGLNTLVDSFVRPINVTSEYIDRIAKGDIPAKITDTYNGDFNNIKNNLNQLIDIVANFTNELTYLSKSANEGHLGVRGDASKYQGDWSKILVLVNQIIDELLAPISETVNVLQEMAQGNLSTRMTGQYNGEHNLLKENINTTLELMPFKEAISVLQSMAEGDFRNKMNGEYKGDSLKLKVALNETIDAISDIIHNVMNTVDEVTRGAMQVADASTELSQGATEQAASLEEITSSMSEIGSQTRANAQNASEANKLTEHSKISAEKGYSEMSELNGAMKEITQSSQEISKIIKVIDEIAFQTNLLALNAAVEAARAGRHGKGFAVVAEEVRNLAARSAGAAKETAELIANSIRSVDAGANLAKKTAEALEEIKNGAQNVFVIVNEIAQSSNEQAQGIYQINEGLQQIDKVTQTNTASAEESASASEELSGQARNLKQLLQRFKVQGMTNQVHYNDFRHNTPSLNKRATRSLPPQAPKPSQHNEEDWSVNPEDVINLDGNDFGRY